MIFSHSDGLKTHSGAALILLCTKIETKWSNLGVTYGKRRRAPVSEKFCQVVLLSMEGYIYVRRSRDGDASQGALCSHPVSGSIDPQLGSMPAEAEHLSVPFLSWGESSWIAFLPQPVLELGLQDMTGTEEGANTGGCLVNTTQECTISFIQWIQGLAYLLEYLASKNRKLLTACDMLPSQL